MSADGRNAKVIKFGAKANNKILTVGYGARSLGRSSRVRHNDDSHSSSVAAESGNTASNRRVVEGIKPLVRKRGRSCAFLVNIERRAVQSSALLLFVLG